MSSKGQISPSTVSPNKATPSPFTDVLQTAPRLLQLLDSRGLAALASSSKQLRSLIHAYVTRVSIIEQNGYGTEYQVTELEVFVNGGWTQLQKMNLKFRARLEPAAVAQLSRGSWPHLTTLDLSRNSLGEAAVVELVAGNWPALKTMNLSHNKLGTAALALLSQADWPLLDSIELR